MLSCALSFVFRVRQVNARDAFMVKHVLQISEDILKSFLGWAHGYSWSANCAVIEHFPLPTQQDRIPKTIRDKRSQT